MSIDPSSDGVNNFGHRNTSVIHLWEKDVLKNLEDCIASIKEEISMKSEKTMADRISSEKRSQNMAAIKGKDTSIELEVRRYLFSKGYRFRKNDKRYPGKPDIVLPKYKTVIFIHGCFWHRHAFCKRASTPSTNVEFWLNKFEQNVANDKKHYEELEKMGWHVIVIWECELTKKLFEDTMQRVIYELGTYYVEVKCDSDLNG